MKIVLFAAAGAAGTLARYFLGGLFQRLAGSSFPYGTFAVNMIGCLLFGIIWVLAEERLVLSAQTRAVCLIGFMGAFTTFSSFIFESAALMRDAEWAMAFGNILAQNILGLACLFVGLAIGRLL